MKLIIDINDEIYKEILIGKDGWSNYVHGLIRTGTPLPKGHGRLIDADDLKRIGRYTHTNTDIDNAPTIIEAESEG